MYMPSSPIPFIMVLGRSYDIDLQWSLWRTGRLEIPLFLEASCQIPNKRSWALKGWIWVFRCGFCSLLLFGLVLSLWSRTASFYQRKDGFPTWGTGSQYCSSEWIIRLQGWTHHWRALMCPYNLFRSDLWLSKMLIRDFTSPPVTTSGPLYLQSMVNKTMRLCFEKV